MKTADEMFRELGYQRGKCLPFLGTFYRADGPTIRRVVVNRLSGVVTVAISGCACGVFTTDPTEKEATAAYKLLEEMEEQA